MHDVGFVVAEEHADTAAKTLGRPASGSTAAGGLAVQGLHRGRCRGRVAPAPRRPRRPIDDRGADDVEAPAIAMPVLPPTQVVSGS